MMVTAKEAATKRCQEGFAAGPVMNSGGATMMAMAGSCFAQTTSPMFCIAGQCMAWHWTDQRTLDGELIGHCGKIVQHISHVLTPAAAPGAGSPAQQPLEQSPSGPPPPPGGNPCA